jgi:hypothetical protein
VAKCNNAAVSDVNKLRIFVLALIKVQAGNFSLHHPVQNGSGAHPASYPMGTRGSFPGGKAAEA